LCNDLLERFERFLVVEKMESDEMLKSNLLLESIRENDYEILMEKQINKSSTVFSREVDRSSDYFLQKYLYEKMLQNVKTNYEKKEDIKKFLTLNSYLDISIQLDAFYVIEKLRHAIDLITWSKQYKTEIKINIDETIKLLDDLKIDDIPSIKIYALLYKMLTKEDSKNLYSELKELAKLEIYNFPKIEQAEIFDALFSYCIKWVNKGDMTFHREYLDLHEWGITKEIILKKGVLSPTSFRNFIVIGLRMNEFQRVENYIKNNLYLLEEFRQDNALNFNMARVYWYKKDFESVLVYLNKVNYDDIWYNINSRYYLLTSYYELGEFDVLESSIESFLAFLRREKSIDTARKKNQILFANLIKKLVRYQTEANKLRKLKIELEAKKSIPNRNWLLEKIEELL
jgi:hypothetical protein